MVEYNSICVASANCIRDVCAIAVRGLAGYGLPWKNPNFTSDTDVVNYITFITALPITIAAETLTIKYQKKKFLWLNTIPFALIALPEIIKSP